MKKLIYCKMAEWPWLMWWEFYILQCHCPAHKYQMTYMSYTLELHVYPITMPSKPKLPEERAAQVDLHVNATWQRTQQLLLSSPALEMRLLENWSAECVQFFETFMAYYIELNWGTKENPGPLTFLREMPRKSWRWWDKAGWYSAQEKVSMKGSCMCMT